MTWAERLDELKAGTATPPPVVETLKLGLLDDWGPGWARKTWRPDPSLLNVDGTQFGGYLAALADQMLALATLTVLPGDASLRTINLSVRFFRIGRAQPVEIESRVTAQSRSLISVEADFHSGGELLAKADAQQMVVGAGR